MVPKKLIQIQTMQLMISNKNLSCIKILITITPFIFISQITDYTNIWDSFGLQIGSLFGLFLANNITKYGTKNALIFGGLIFFIFGLQFFLTDIKIIMSLFCGFGYSIICYELLLKTDYISKVHSTKEKYIIQSSFIMFYLIVGLIFIATSAKLHYFIDSIIIFVFFILFLFISILASIYFNAKNLIKSTILMISGLWICAISTDIYILCFGCAILALSMGVLIKTRAILLQNSSIINNQMLIGIILSGFVAQSIKIEFLYYFIFIISLIYTLFLMRIKKYLIIAKS